MITQNAVNTEVVTKRGQKKWKRTFQLIQNLLCYFKWFLNGAKINIHG